MFADGAVALGRDTCKKSKWVALVLKVLDAFPAQATVVPQDQGQRRLVVLGGFAKNNHLWRPGVTFMVSGFEVARGHDQAVPWE